MWIHNKNILLKIAFEHYENSTNLDVNFLDSKLQNMKFENLSRIDTNTQTVCAKIDMPANLYLIIDQNNFAPTKVVDISLGHISFSKELLTQVFEYKMNYEQKPYQIDQLLQLGSHRTVDFAYSGVMCFNFFDIDPIHYHMHMGNKIKAFRTAQSYL